MANPKEIKKLVRVNKSEYYELHLSLINCILPEKMTPMEIRVLAAFMSLEGDIAEYRFKTAGRNVIMDRLGLKPASLSNYFRSLKDKGFLIEDKEEVTVLPLLQPNKEEQWYHFRLINTGEEPEIVRSISERLGLREVELIEDHQTNNHE